MKVQDLLEQLVGADLDARVLLWLDHSDGYHSVGAGILNGVEITDSDLGRVYLVGTDGTT